MQHTAVNLATKSWAPSNSWNFIEQSHSSLGLFCCHCRRHSYLTGITFLQLCCVIHSSLNKAHNCGYQAMAGKI